MSLNNTLAQLALVACDASYNAAIVQNQALADYDDHISEPDTWRMPATWFNSNQLNAWKAWDEAINIGTTGFGAVVYKNAATNEVLVALRGSDGEDPQDWFANLGLGMTQWDPIAKNDLFAQIAKAIGTNTDAVVHFTGQSLGGCAGAVCSL